jgi:HKD family nuclease
MTVDFIAQPHATFRIGDFLTHSFADPRWLEFRAAVAFVKRSGTKHIREALRAFIKRGGIVKMSAGIDSGGTSVEGLTDLMEIVAPGSLCIFKNANSSTFHPKVYLFKNATDAEIVVGSGNLTEGGIFTNYEASFLVRLDLANADNAALLATILQALDEWSTPAAGLCYSLDAALLEQLVLKGEVPDEIRAWGDETRTSNTVGIEPSERSLFTHHSVRAAPKAARTTAVSAPNIEEIGDEDENLVVIAAPVVPAQAGANKVFLMTLQNTDVGVGQTTQGTSRRSPEIFIPLVSRDCDPDFWGWPDLFVADKNWDGQVDQYGRGKMDRAGVMVRLGGAIYPVNMWYNPQKRDLRLRSEHMRSAGSVGDILYVERSDGTGGFSYYVDVVPIGSPRHVECLAKCTRAVRNSKKLWGYY